MKKIALTLSTLCSSLTFAATSIPSQNNKTASPLYSHSSIATSISKLDKSVSAQRYIEKAQQQNLAQHMTWQRLMYANTQGQSDVSYTGYFISDEGKSNLKQELTANIQALFESAEPNQSVRCRFPARSHWLIQQLSIPNEELPQVTCPEFNS